MKFKFAAMGLVSLILTTCSTPANGALPIVENVKIQSSFIDLTLSTKAEETLMKKQIAQKIQMAENNKKILLAISELRKYVGKTWYVFSGNTPSGWDCSGLTMWFYQQLGVDLEHRASRQENSGTITNNPLPGDIVVFKYKGQKDAYHVGIYVSNDTMIHAPKHGHVTREESISTFSGKYSDVSYVRVLDN